MDYYLDYQSSSQLLFEEIQTAFSQSNMTNIQKQAHKLKSSAKTIGTVELSKICLNLEMNAKNKHVDKVENLIPEFNEVFNTTDQWITAFIQHQDGAIQSNV